MNSPILEYLAYYGIDPAWIMVGMLAVMFLMIALYIRCVIKMKKLYKGYDRFMRGKDMESMEDQVMEQFDRLEILEEADKQKRDELNALRSNMLRVYQKTGLVKYNAFREMSGQLSYSLALLDQNNDGVLITSMYSREGCYSYAKEVKGGKSSINLSEEEEEALNLAVAGDKITE